MALTASVPISRAQTTLYDETGVRWAESELIDYLNAAISAIMLNKPDANPVTANITMTANESLQDLPTDGIQLLKVLNNVSGTKRTITQIDRNHLDHSNPDWRSQTGSAVYHYMFEKENPTQFEVFPVPSTGFDIRITYSAQPARITATTDSIEFIDLYENSLYFYIVAMAYAKNTVRGDLNKANSYFTMFANSIGAKTQVQFAFSPVPPDKDIQDIREPV